MHATDHDVRHPLGHKAVQHMGVYGKSPTPLLKEILR